MTTGMDTRTVRWTSEAGTVRVTIILPIGKTEIYDVLALFEHWKNKIIPTQKYR